MKQRFLTASHHVNKAAVELARVTIQHGEMDGTRCSYCVCLLYKLLNYWCHVEMAANGDGAGGD